MRLISSSRARAFLFLSRANRFFVRRRPFVRFGIVEFSIPSRAQWDHDLCDLNSPPVLNWSRELDSYAPFWVCARATSRQKERRHKSRKKEREVFSLCFPLDAFVGCASFSRVSVCEKMTSRLTSIQFTSTQNEPTLSETARPTERKNGRVKTYVHSLLQLEEIYPPHPENFHAED